MRAGMRWSSIAAVCFCAAVLVATTSTAGTIDKRLESRLRSTAPDELVSVSVIMGERLDYDYLHSIADGLPKMEARRALREEATAITSESQARVRSLVEAAQANGHAARVRYLHAVNVVCLSASPSLIWEVARLPEVETVIYNERAYALAGLESRPARARCEPAAEPGVARGDTAWGVLWIGAPDVWQLGYYGQGARVAIMDTGIWYIHPDLINRMWTNPGEIPNNYIDDDNNGYVDDYYGFNFDTHTSDPTDQNGHGTHVSGTVAGDGTNGTLTGVAPAAKLMGIRVLDAGGWGEEENVWEAIEYSVDMGADVLQGSIGWIHFWHYPTRPPWRDACSYALAGNAIMSYCAGNERGYFSPPDVVRTPGDVPPPWLHPDQTLQGGLNSIVTVGATGYHTDNYAGFSSNGPVTWENEAPYYDYPYQPEMGLIDPDMCAPGENVNSTTIGGGYSGDTWSGTSMATPHNSGLIALMLSKNPTLTPAQIDSIIETTALDRGPAGKDNDYGAGRIQALEAIIATPLAGPPPDVTIALEPSVTSVPQGGSFQLEATLENTTASPQTIQAWNMVRRGSTWIGPRRGPVTLLLEPYEVKVFNLTEHVPATAPIDTYTYYGRVGCYPGPWLDQDSFDIDVTAP